MNKIFFILVFLYISASIAEDRLYTADEVSNTVSVINPSTDELKGVIYLGHSRPYSYSSFTTYNSQINVHGIDYSKSANLLAVTSNVTNSVVIFDLAAKQYPKIISIGRSPHTSNFTPDGKELWANIRGEDFVQVIDTSTGKLLTRMKTDKGPSFTSFLKRNNLAFVTNTWTGQLQVFDRKKKKLLKTIPLLGKFNPVMQLSPDEKQLWIVLKDKNKVARVDTNKLEVIDNIDTGSFTQHPAFLTKNGITYGLVTVGGENKLKIYKFDHKSFSLFKTVDVDGVPHGVWSSNNGEKIYVATEHGDTLQVIGTDDYSVQKTIRIGQSPQALVLATGLDSKSLKTFEEIAVKPLGLKDKTTTLFLNGETPSSTLSISIREMDTVDFFEFRVFNYPMQARLNIYKISTNGKERELLGIVNCEGSFTCTDYASFPHDDSKIKSILDGSVIAEDASNKKTVFTKDRKDSLK